MVWCGGGAKISWHKDFMHEHQGCTLEVDQTPTKCRTRQWWTTISRLVHLLIRDS
jgi:hypothetical protein